MIQTLRKIPNIHLISWSGNFVQRHSFRRVSGKSPEALRKLCLSIKFPYQKVGWNFGILRSERNDLTQWAMLGLFCRHHQNNEVNNSWEYAFRISLFLQHDRFRQNYTKRNVFLNCLFLNSYWHRFWFSRKQQLR